MPQNVGTFFVKTASTRFVVRNIAPNGKTVRVFNYPIKNGQTRDLLAVPQISEADIRVSCLKGELFIKFKHRELEVVESNIDLLQFDTLGPNNQKAFLQSVGVVDGLEVTALSGGGLTLEQHKKLRHLIHLADGVGGPMEGFNNSVRFTLPLNDPFPTQIIWYTNASMTTKIVEKLLSYDASKRITLVEWKVYDESGLLLATVTDTITYTGASPFETSRTRIVG